jgi:hypothetical protein
MAFWLDLWAFQKALLFLPVRVWERNEEGEEEEEEGCPASEKRRGVSLA